MGTRRVVSVLLVFLVAAVLLVVVFWHGSETQRDEGIVITDLAGRRVTLPENPQRIVAVGGGALRLITYLDATDLVVGVEDIEKSTVTRPYLLVHPELSGLPPAGPRHGGDAELIAALRPDIIFLTRWTDKMDTLQSSTGAPVVYLGDSEADFDELYSALRVAGESLGRGERAEELIGYTESAIADLKKRSENVHYRPRVYVGGMGRSENGILETRTDYIPFALLDARTIEDMPGVELPSKIKEGQMTIDPEILLEWGPEYIFIDAGGHALQDLDKPMFSPLSPKGISEVLPYRDYGDNYETILVDSYFIGSIIYPESFSDVDPAKKADEIYTMFVGAPVYKDMKDIWLGGQ
jgi:iron complex transport system substrate-binding protein